MKITIEIKVPNAAPTSGNYRLLRTLVTSGALGLVENVLAASARRLAIAGFALDAQITFQYDEDETVTLPAVDEDRRVAQRREGRQHGQRDGVVVHADEPDDGRMPPLVRAEEPLHRSGPYTELAHPLASLSRIARQPIVLAGGK